MFFLWGPRQSGKSTLLAEQFPDAPRIDLLRPDVYRRYLQTPELLIEEQKLAIHEFIVIDEIQRVPELLDAVHWLIENRGVAFALCGSSARKVRRGHANLLGGRGIRHELHGLSAIEIGDNFDIARLLNHGYFPAIYDADDPRSTRIDRTRVGAFSLCIRELGLSRTVLLQRLRSPVRGYRVPAALIGS